MLVFLMDFKENPIRYFKFDCDFDLLDANIAIRTSDAADISQN